jgi:subfamily B ATP-binding cassette protein MsbA
MTLSRFLLQYFRRYVGWSALAAVAILSFALSTLALVALVAPIFRDVLLSQPPAGLAVVENLGGARPAAEAPADTPLARAKAWLGKVFDVKALIDAGYGWLRDRLGVDDTNVVVFVPVLFVAVFLLRGASDFLSGYAFQHIGLGATTDIRNDLYRRILDQSTRFYARHPSGELVSRVVNDIALIQNAISSRLLDLFQQSVTLLALTLYLVSSNPRLALICLVVAPALVYPIVRFGKGMRRTSHRSQERMADLANLVTEGVRGHRVVKAFGMEAFEHERFKAATARHLRVNLWGQVLSNLSSPVVESLAVIASGFLLVFAGRAIRAGSLEPAMLMSIVVNLLMMYDPIRKLNKVNLILQQSLAAAQRVRDLMAEPLEISDRPAARPLPPFANSIELVDVHFAYDDEPVLRGIDLTIRKGETVALVGRNGSGKSTIVSLVPRFYDPDRGRLAIDGHDLREVTLRSLRDQIAVVTQETILFADTVRANIAYGRADVPLERVREAARAAYADEFISALPEGYDTILGEGGAGLSGGQRQRLAIARAILRDAPILILDEATSALDPESESLVQQALPNLMRGRTTLVIAHRLSTVRSADRIVVIDSGRIVESGTHEQLIARDGLYRQLHDLQFAA